jgi:tetratricopeptide (TPR) repeat protein
MKKSTLCALCLLSLPLTASVASPSDDAQGQRQRPSRSTAQSGERKSDAKRILPKVTPDPTRAPQAEVDSALFTVEEFFGATARVPRPFAEAKQAIAQLQAKYPNDSRLLRYGANLDERLGDFPSAVDQMRRYAALRNDTPNALRRLAAFYHGRVMYADEVQVLQKLAPVAFPYEREAIYQQIAELVRRHALEGFDLAAFYKKLLDAAPDDARIPKQYVAQLIERKRYADALRALDELQPKYPDALRDFLKTRAAVYEMQDRRDAAEAAYATAFNPLWPRAVVSDWYDLLRRIGRYRAYRRDLQEKFLKRNLAEFDLAARLFNIYAYEGNFTAARRVFSQLEARREAQGWKRQELETAAAMCLQVGSYDQAARFLYSLHVAEGLKPNTPEREATLAKLAVLLLDAKESATPVAAGDLTFYQDVAKLDEGAGFLNGVLSLILAGNNIPAEYAKSDATSVAYFNRALAHRFYLTLNAEFPNSPMLSEVQSKLLDAFYAMGEYETVVKIGDDFLHRFPKSPDANRLTLRIAEAEARLNRRPAERQRLIALLDRLAAERRPGQPLVSVSSRRWTFNPYAEDGNETVSEASRNYQVYDPSDQEERDGGNFDYDYQTNYLGDREDAPEAVTYAAVLERALASYAADQSGTEGDAAANSGALKFLYGEVKKYPREEGLHERLLKWLGQRSLVDEQLQAYTQAVRRFGNNTWHHRLGRWFVRNDRQEAFAQYSREIVETLDDGDIAEYLQRFLSSVNLAENGNDAKLYLELYRFAHDRFPGNALFVNGLLKYYRETNQIKAWERLASEYYFADPTLREAYLTHLSKNSRLRADYERAKRGGAAGAYAQFAADGALWLSRHEEAVVAYRELIKKYPGAPQYADRLINVARSLGKRDPKYYEEAAGICQALAKVRPTDHRHATQAGEIFAELGDFDRAKREWDSLLTNERGVPETYLEVASIHWDYYRYDDAIRTLQELRKTTGDATAYAYQMGALQEERRRIDDALAEYVAALEAVGQGRDQAVKRLTQLAARRDYAERIARQFQARAARPDAGSDLVFGYAQYLRERNRPNEATELLTSEARRRNSIDFLEAVLDELRRDRRTDEQRPIFERLVALARDEREAMKYRLQYASFAEQTGQTALATETVDRLTADFPTNLGVVQEAAQFYWRNGQLDKSIALQERTREKATGDYRRRFTVQLAKRQIDAKRLADAERTLRAWYAENPTDVEVFSLLARTLGDSDQPEALAVLYKDAAKTLGKGDGEIPFRKGYIDTLTRLKRHSEAVDQFIEIINRAPEDQSALGEAMRYAARYDQLPRLTSYYIDLAKKADRNYRWNFVLGELYRFQGNVIEAAGQYRLATLNEPQRGDFRLALANLYAQIGRYDEATATLRRAYELDPQNPEWLVSIAKLFLTRGDAPQAAATLREAVAARKKTAARVRFAYGKILFDAGLIREASAFYEEGFRQVSSSPATERFTEEDAANWLSVVVRLESPLAATTKLEALESAVERAADNPRLEVAASAKSLLADAVRARRLPQVIRDYATPAQLAELDGALFKRLTLSIKKNLFDDKASNLAAAVGLFQTQEAALLHRKDSAEATRGSASNTEFPQALRALIDFYYRRGDFQKAVATLEAEQKRDRFPEAFDYPQAIAETYRRAGDAEGEIAALDVFYRKQTEGLATDASPLVERYLTLLHARNDRARLASLAGSHSAYQLQLINFLAKNREKDLARAAIASAAQSKAWRTARTAQLELYFRNAAPEVEKLFTEALAVRPIGEKAGRAPNFETELIGDDWHRAARNYGVWLSLSDRRADDAKKYIVAETEFAPRSSAAQRTLADYLRRAKRYAEAQAHVKLARELDPNDYLALAVEGAILAETGDRAAALATWTRMIADDKRPNEAYVRYLAVMAEHGALREALPALEKRLGKLISNPQNDIAAWKPLAEALGEQARKDAASGEAVAQAFLRTAQAAPNHVALLWIVVNEKLLPDSLKTPFYPALLERLAESVITAYSNGDYGFYDSRLDDIDVSSPADALDAVQKKWIDRLVGARDYERARNELTAVAAKRRLLFRQLRENAPDDLYYDTSKSEPEPEWLIMAQAVVDLRTGRTPQAVARLRKFIGLDRDARAQGGDEMNRPPDAAYLHAYALLVNEGRQAEADALLGEHYQETLADENAVTAYAGLAEIEFRRGRAADALKQLRQLVERRPTFDALTSAAAVAARYGQFAPALEWRRRAVKLAPQAAENRIELARIAERAGDAKTGLSILGDLIADRDVANASRGAAFAQFGDMARRHPATANETLARYQGKTDADALTATALLQEAGGDADAARATLERAAATPYAYLARIERAKLAQRGNQPAAALRAYQAAQREATGQDLRLQIAAALLAANRPESALEVASSVERETPTGETSEFESFNYASVAAQPRSANQYRSFDQESQAQAEAARRQLLQGLSDAAFKLNNLNAALDFLSALRSLAETPQEIADSERRIAEALRKRARLDGVKLRFAPGPTGDVSFEDTLEDAVASN